MTEAMAEDARPFSLECLRLHVGDCDEAGRMFARLGFAVTPRSRLPGLSNRLICFEPSDPRGASFIELLSIDDRSRASPQALELLETAGRRPVAAVVCCPDAERLAKAIDDDRIELRRIARSWQLQDETMEVRLATLNVPPAVSPLGWAAIEHHTPQHYRIQRFTAHPNGVTALAAIIAVADEPHAVGRHFEALWRGELRDMEGGVALRIGKTELRIFDAGSAEQRYGAALGDRQARLLGAVLTTSDFAELPHHLQDLRLNGAGETYLPPASPESPLLVFAEAARREADTIYPLNA